MNQNKPAFKPYEWDNTGFQPQSPCGWSMALEARAGGAATGEWFQQLLEEPLQENGFRSCWRSRYRRMVSEAAGGAATGEWFQQLLEEPLQENGFSSCWRSRYRRMVSAAAGGAATGEWFQQLLGEAWEPAP